MIIVLYKAQGYIAFMPNYYYAPNNIHPIIGGLVNASTTPVDGNTITFHYFIVRITFIH
jgi:hypothetical protein